MKWRPITAKSLLVPSCMLGPVSLYRMTIDGRPNAWWELLLTGLGMGLFFAVVQRLNYEAEHVQDDLNALAKLEHHDYISVQLEDYPHLDRTFYDRTTYAITRLGFDRLDDLEDKTMTQASPYSASVLRLFQSQNRTVFACCYHRLAKSEESTAPDRERRDLLKAYAIQFESIASTGDRLVTNNLFLKIRQDLPPWCLETDLETASSAAELYEAHCDRIQEYTSLHPEVEWVEITTVNDFIEAENSDRRRIAQ